MSRIMKVTVAFLVKLEVDIDGPDWLECGPQFQEEYLLELADQHLLDRAEQQIEVVRVPPSIIQEVSMKDRGWVPDNVRRLVDYLNPVSLTESIPRDKHRTSHPAFGPSPLRSQGT